MKLYSPCTIRALLKICSLKGGTQFLAKDFGIAGGTMHGLDLHSIVRFVEERESDTLIHLYDNHYIKPSVTVWETIRTKKYLDKDKQFKKSVQEILTTAKMLEEYGYKIEEK